MIAIARHVLLAAILASSAASQWVTNVHVPYLSVARNEDARLVMVRDAPLKLGALFVEWRKADGSPDIFRFFVSGGPSITARTTYTRPSYVDPRVRMQLSMTGGAVVLFDRSIPPGPDHWNTEVTFSPERWYRLAWVWAEVDGIVYLAAYVDDRLVAYRRIVGAKVGRWAIHPVFIGARDYTAVEPSFPAQHHVGGELRNLWMGGVE